MKKVVIVVVSITFFIFVVFFILGSVFTDKFVDEEIAKVKNLSASANTLLQIDSLDSYPLMLKKYFKNSIPDSSYSSSYAYLKLNGEIKTGENSNWQQVTAEEHLSVSQPAYIWNAKLKMNDIVSARAIETYINGTGNILIKLFSSLKISDATGGYVDQSGLTRYLCDAVFVPSALLPNEFLEWEFVEQGKVKGTLRFKDLKADADFYFNSSGEVTRIETSDRYRTTPAGYVRNLLSITLSDYRTFGSYKIPTYFETAWQTKNGKFVFGKFNITDAQYY